VIVKAAEPDRLRAVLTDAGGKISTQDDCGLIVRSLDARHIGELAAQAGVALWELSPQLASLEDAFRELTHDNRDFSAAPTPEPDAHQVPVLTAASAAGGTR
jgi:ABC-2 type transport system ATP-binding protein